MSSELLIIPSEFRMDNQLTLPIESKTTFLCDFIKVFLFPQGTFFNYIDKIGVSLTTYLPWIDIYEGISLLFSAAASEWAGWALAHPEFGSSVNPITTRGQIMPYTLLLAHPDLKTQRHLWQIFKKEYSPRKYGIQYNNFLLG